MLTNGSRPFADAVRAGVGSVMCSYNKINGDYSCENAWTNNYLLKNELDFQGFGKWQSLLGRYSRCGGSIGRV